MFFSFRWTHQDNRMAVLPSSSSLALSRSYESKVFNCRLIKLPTQPMFHKCCTLVPIANQLFVLTNSLFCIHPPLSTQATLAVDSSPSKFFLIHSVVTDLGRSIGNPSARSQTRFANGPIALDTPNNTV